MRWFVGRSTWWCDFCVVSKLVPQKEYSGKSMHRRLKIFVSYSNDYNPRTTLRPRPYCDSFSSNCPVTPSYMSALEACNLYVGGKLFLQWRANDNDSPMVLAIVTRVELFHDMNPSHLSVLVTRQNLSDVSDNTLQLTIHQYDSATIPSICYSDSGETVVWSLPPGSVMKLPGSASSSLHSPSAYSLMHQPTMSNAYSRPIRAISSDAYASLSKFPVVSGKNLEELNNRIRCDLRAKTTCSLLEWESLVQHVTVRLNIPVCQDPKYDARDVPRYDVDEMSLHFATLHGLLRIFRHFTTSNIRRLIVKDKKRRKRRHANGLHAFANNGVRMVQVIGENVCKRELFAFTIGSVFQPEATQSPGFRYPLLYRTSNSWNYRDRMFQEELQIEWKNTTELKLLQASEEGHANKEQHQRKSRQGRKRVTESFLGFRWIRSKDLKAAATNLQSFNPDDVYGTLHFCAPSTVFVGALFGPDILKLVHEQLAVFDLQ